MLREFALQNFSWRGRVALRTGMALLTAAAVGGCASVPPGLDLHEASLVVDPAPARVHVDVSTSAGRGTGIGALSGTGAGAAAAPLLCIPSGFLYPVCLLAVVSSGAGIGAATGAAVGSSLKDSDEARRAKLELVKKQVGARAYQRDLAAYVQNAAAGIGARWPVADDRIEGPAVPQAPPWIIEVALVDIGTDGKERFQFQVEAHLRLLRSGQAQPVFEKSYSEDGDSALTLAQWADGDAAAVDRELDRIMQVLGRRMFRDLTRADAAEYQAWHTRRSAP